jgi:hypothetical protein
MVVLSLLVVLAGCFAPKAEVTVRNWRPLGAGGLALAQVLALSPNAKNVVWESLDGAGDETVVRVSVEYDPRRAAANCPPPAAGLATAARCFLLLDFSVTPGGVVTFFAAKAQTYSAKGYFQEYPLDIGVMADLVARVFPLPCEAIALPSYL